MNVSEAENRLVRALREALEKLGPEEDYPGQLTEFRLATVIRVATSAADAIIMEGSNGTVEETDYLTSAVAQAFVGKVHCAMQSKLLRKQFESRGV